jgi:hypothetical protein
MRDHSPCPLRLIRGGRHDGDGRETVDVVRHDTGALASVVWTLPRLLAAIRRRPRRGSDRPARTFAVGRGRRRVVVAANGPSRFDGQHRLWTDTGRPAGAMLFDALSFAQVRRVLERFYAGESLDRCFDGLAGDFKLEAPAAPASATP